MNVATAIRESFADQTWDAATPLTALPGIGKYLEGRVRRALLPPQRRLPITMYEFVDALRPLSTTRVVLILQRALQNARSNQCVASSPARNMMASPPRTYHTGDINEIGYEALVALLDYAKRNRLFGLRQFRYVAPLPRLRRRNRATRNCGCRSREECRHAPSCTYVDGLCVPKDNRVRGFTGSPYHPDQVVIALSEDARRAVRRSARTSITNRVRDDAGSFTDLNRGHSPNMEYVVRGTRMWRKPSPKVRLPVARKR